MTAKHSAPCIKQLVGAAGAVRGDQEVFERKLYVIRRLIEIAAGPDLVVRRSRPHDRLQGHAHRPAALGYFPDLKDPRLKTRLGSSTRASRPTRSRAGSSPIRTA